MNVVLELFFDGLLFVSSASPVSCHPLTRDTESQSPLHKKQTKLYIRYQGQWCRNELSSYFSYDGEHSQAVRKEMEGTG